EYDGLRIDGATVPEPDSARRAMYLEADDLARGQQFGAELSGLPACPVGQLGAGHAVGKAEVVLDPGALARLAAGRRPFDQDGSQALRCPVDRGPESGRAAADDDQVVEGLRRRGGEAHPAG